MPDATILSMSPERFLQVDPRRRVETRPIKGTARDAADLLDSVKDRAENVMIVDLVRNDLSRVCATGSVHVPDLLAIEEHPGLVHLVSYVDGVLRADVRWPQILEATFPPGSVSGAPKRAAMQVIHALEPVERSFYCGAFGWVDADTGEIRLRRMLGVFTGGRILNPKTARSQAIGGMVFGVGAALMEAVEVDPRYGIFVNHDLAEYHVPVNADVPAMEAILVHEDDAVVNNLGVKGVGEIGITGTVGAIANAVWHATGVRVREMPITLDKLL